MNISFYSKTPYPLYVQSGRQGKALGNQGGIPGRYNMSYAALTPDMSVYGQEAVYEKPAVSQEMRRLIRDLNKTSGQDQNPYAVNSDGRVNGFPDISGSPDKEEEESSKKPVNYNYKEVSAKIQQAKTSVSAEQAVLAASRKVLDIKRKISSHEGDPEELQLALTHAKRMEMAARKKKHHLELEEMADNTRKRDEVQDKLEETCENMENALVSIKEEKVSEEEDAIFDERTEMIHEAEEQFKESGRQVSEDMLSDLNEMIAEFGEEELKELEEAMEMLENMEVIDPHMSKEDLDDLKRKHRAAENKAIMKADMDYLKDMIKHQLDKGGSIPGISSGGVNTGISITSVPAGAGISLSAAVPETASFDGGSMVGANVDFTG